MSREEAHEIVVVGGGVAGCFAAATAAAAGADVVQLERKPASEAGYIACGDAIKNPTDPKKFPGPLDMDSIAADEAVLIDGNIDQIEWWDEELGVRKVIPYADHSQVIDRYEFGQRLLDQTAALGVDQQFDTVVNGVRQNGQVTGVEAIQNDEEVTYTADVVIDAAGAQSILQDLIDFDSLGDRRVTFDKPNYTHFGSAYREIIETDEPVDYANAIVGKPLEEMGYIWYFPRTSTEINVGLGFQMNKEPIPLADRLKEDIEDRPEYQNAELDEKFDKKNKLGAALALRRPLDSMVAPGYLAAGGAAATTHPITGKGIRGAALSGYSAGKHAAEAVQAGDTSERGLWGHNYYLYIEHGEAAMLAARDAYNVAASVAGIAELRAVAALLPEQEMREIIGTEREVDGIRSKLSVATGITKNFIAHQKAGTFEKLDVSPREVLSMMNGLRKTKEIADQLEAHYSKYPADPDGFFEWQAIRNQLDDSLYEAVGAEDSQRKY